MISPEHPVRVVDGLITGWHNPEASHLLLVESVAGAELTQRAYDAAVAEHYLWHEFGDSCVFLVRLLAHRALSNLLAPLAAMFAGLPPSSSDLAGRKSVVPPSPPADRRREHREPPCLQRRAIPDARSLITSVKP